MLLVSSFKSEAVLAIRGAARGLGVGETPVSFLNSFQYRCGADLVRHVHMTREDAGGVATAFSDIGPPGEG